MFLVAGISDHMSHTLPSAHRHTDHLPTHRYLGHTRESFFMVDLYLTAVCWTLLHHSYNAFKASTATTQATLEKHNEPTNPTNPTDPTRLTLLTPQVPIVGLPAGLASGLGLHYILAPM
jgi:hypothetical protein